MERTFHTTTKQSAWVLPPTFWSMTQPNTENLAASFAPISLKQMEAVALLNRIDTKFVMTTGQLLTALAQIQPDYWMLSINGQRMNRYRTLYFDSPDFALYHAHVTGRAERYKVRSREYLDSHLSFLEVKHKTRKNRTIKDRIPTENQVVRLSTEMNRWLQQISPLDGETLEPKLWNTFTRLTLVSKQFTERVTLDIDLTFYAGTRVARLDGLAIAEVKMDANFGNSPFLEQMRAQRICQKSFSKYSIGVASLYDQVKKNSIKPKMLWLEKMMKGASCNERTN